MKTLTLGTKVILLLAIALLLTSVMAAASLLVTSRLGRTIREYQSAKIPSLEALASLAIHLAEASGQAAAVENQDADEATHGAALHGLAAAVAAAKEDAARFAAVPRSADENMSWSLTSEGLSAWFASLQKLEKAAGERAARADSFAEAAAAQHDVSNAFTASRLAIQSLVGQVQDTARLTREASARAGEEADRTQSASRGLLGGVFAVAVLLLGLGGAALALSTRRTLAVLQHEARRLRDAVAAGRIDVRADAGTVAHEFAPIVHGMNETMDAFERPVRFLAEHVTRLGRGDIPAPVTERWEGDFDLIKESLNGCIAAVGSLVADTRTLAQAGVEGRLGTRADASRHQGDFRKVVQGVNDTLDAFVGPLRGAAEAIDSLSKGHVPARITAPYQGDFALIRDNLNRCIDAVNLLVTDVNGLAEAGAAGRLSARADAARHQGDFRRIVEGVNRALDAVIGPLDVAARAVADLAAGRIPPPIADAYQGDFARLRDNLNTCLEAVNRLVADTKGLVEAASTGQLSHRADAARHQGDFARILEGVNRTLDVVTAPVNEASAVLEKMAARDLRARMAGSYQGDHGRIRRAINGTGDALQDALVQVARAVEQVSGAAAQIASSSQAVASGASEQASSLEEISGSIESVSAMTRHSAESAQQANTLAGDARAAAAAGASAVEQLQAAMGNIRQSADRTGQIIKDVSDIAFQTNLLALNAAVEAARAGEAGRGFAVVAEEVRSLALRAKEAAQKTEELIRESVRQAGQGDVAASQVSTRLSEIVQGVSRVTDIVTEIAASAREQSDGIAQVNSAIGEMDKVTQQNAASAEESSSAASELNAQAEELASMVSTFHLDEGAEPEARPGPRRLRSVLAPPVAHER